MKQDIDDRMGELPEVAARPGPAFGHARVSTSEQDNTLQLDALHRAGAVRVFQEKRAGAGVAVLSPAERAKAAEHYRSGKASLTALARLYGCHLSSVKRAIARVE